MNTMISGTSLSELHKALAGFNGSSRTLDADAIRGMDWMYGSAGTIKARLNERVQELHRLRLKLQEPLRTLPNRGWADEEDAGNDERLNPDATCRFESAIDGLVRYSGESSWRCGTDRFGKDECEPLELAWLSMEDREVAAVLEAQVASIVAAATTRQIASQATADREVEAQERAEFARLSDKYGRRSQS